MKTNMNRKANLEFIYNVQTKVAPVIFENVKDELESIPEKYYRSFLYLLYAGYSIRVIFKSYKNLNRFVKRSYLDFPSGVKLITHLSGRIHTGLDVKDLTLYELN